MTKTILLTSVEKCFEDRLLVIKGAGHSPFHFEGGLPYVEALNHHLEQIDIDDISVNKDDSIEMSLKTDLEHEIGETLYTFSSHVTGLTIQELHKGIKFKVRTTA